jgi:hypothetical protein
MRKWGIVISVFYAAIVLGLLVPGGMILAGDKNPLHQIFSTDLLDVFSERLVWVPIAAVLAGEAILLFLRVDTSQKRLKPRSHIAISCFTSSMLFALLVFAGLSALGATVYGDKFIDKFWVSETQVLAIWLAIWAVWGVVFYFIVRGSSERATRALAWLLKGSVLELLIAVPCHVWVRRREDCSAPIATSFGIVTGTAVMLLSFGPSVLLLFKKRLDGYSAIKPK